MSDSGSSSLREGRSGLSPLTTEANLTQEELTFSFSTSNSPSVLIYVSSRTQDYLAVVLRHNGEIVSESEKKLSGTKVTDAHDIHTISCQYIVILGVNVGSCSV